MNALRPRLAVLLIGVVWGIVFLRPELIMGKVLRAVVLLAVFVVTAVLQHYVNKEEGPTFLGPLVVFSNLLFGVLLIMALRAYVTSSQLFLMLLMLTQMLLIFFLSTTYKTMSEEKNAASSNLLNEKTQQLLYLQQVGIAMNSAEEIKSFLDIVLRATSHITKAERVLLFLKGDEDSLNFEAGFNTDDYTAEVVNFVKSDVVKQSFAEGSSVIYPSPAVDHFDLLELEDEELSKGSLVEGSTYMMLPLVRKDGCWGIFHAERTPEDGDFGFSLVDLEVFRVLAAQISVALENADLYFQMRESYRNTIEALANAIEAKDSYTSGHSSAVTRYAVPVARQLDISENDLQVIEFAAILHDIGKIAVPERVLNKPGKLTREEFEDIKRHPSAGAEIIRSIGFLNEAVPYVKHHHERWDGKGYPDGLAGDEIPLGAQVISIVDTFDAMTSTRSYRKALPEQEAVQEIQRCSGRQFNPKVVEAFLKAFEAGDIVPDDTRSAYEFTEETSFKTEGASANA